MALTHSPSIVRSGLVLHLDAANIKSYLGSGTTWTDLSGNGNTGTLTNGPTYSSANNGSIVFDGIDDYVINSSTTNLPTGSSNRTIALWIYPIGNTNNLVQLGTGGSGTSNQAYIVEYYNTGSAVYLYTDGLNANNNLTISGDEIPTLNSWSYFVFLNNGQNWQYYLNGVLKKNGTWSTTVNTIGQQFVIGKRLDYTSNTTNARISSVQIYNRALSAAEVRQNFEAYRDRYGI